MLELRNVGKDYGRPEEPTRALDKIHLSLGESGMTVFLGPAGSGKSTLLRLLAGEVKCTRGEILYGDMSTAQFSQRDWDDWRCAAVGCLFPGEPLLEDERLLTNIEAAGDLMGLGKRNCRGRAAGLLKKVGLGDCLRKTPRQLSPTQRRRAILARALMNDPDILLCDEPTAELDANGIETMVRLLRAAAQNRLVIVATADETVAELLGGRRIRLQRGRIAADSGALFEEQENGERELRARSGLSLGMAAALALHSARRNGGRTLLGILAGSLSVLALALTLALLSGLSRRVAAAEEDALSATPVTITAEVPTAEEWLAAIRRAREDGGAAGGTLPVEEETALLEAALAGERPRQEVLAQFLDWLEARGGSAAGVRDVLRCDWGVEPEVYASDTSGGLRRVSGAEALPEGLEDVCLWAELPGNTDLLERQYDVLAGRWPLSFNEVVLITGEQGGIGDLTLRSLGILREDSPSERMNYETLLAATFKLLLPTDAFRQGADGLWAWVGGDEDLLRAAVKGAATLHVVGIVRPGAGAAAAPARGSVGYMPTLTEYICDHSAGSAVIAAQQADPATDIFTGLPFLTEEQENLTQAEKAVDFADYALSLSQPDQAALCSRLTGESTLAGEGISASLQRSLAAQSTAQLAALWEEYAPLRYSFSTLEENLARLGVPDTAHPQALRFYAVSAEQQREITELIDLYNRERLEEGDAEGLLCCRVETEAMAKAVTALTETNSRALRMLLALELLGLCALFYTQGRALALSLSAAAGTLGRWGASPRDVSRMTQTGSLLRGAVCGALGVLAGVIAAAAASGLFAVPWREELALVPGTALLSLLMALPSAFRRRDMQA